MSGDDTAGPYEGPPRRFTDDQGREIEIREYGTRRGEEAREALVSMYLMFNPEDRAQGIPPVDEERIRKWLDALLAEECLNVVAWHEDRAVGHATLVPDSTGGYELAIFVLRAYQNAGIGTRMMEALLGLGACEGVERVWLSVERWNEPAIALYRKVGFEQIDDDSFEMKMDLRLTDDDDERSDLGTGPRRGPEE